MSAAPMSAAPMSEARRLQERTPTLPAAEVEADLDEGFSLDGIRDLPSVLARRLAASEATRGVLPHHRQVRYGPRPGQTLDVFPAAGGGRLAPVLLFIHGGFWRLNDAATFSFVAGGFAPAGVLTLVIDYDLIPSVDLGTIVAECEDAVAWARAHAREYGGDPDRIFVSGNSAGGHLAASLADRRWTARRGLPADVVKGCFAVSGIFDLAPVARTRLQEVFRFTAEEIEALSPLRRVGENAAPILLAVGGDETQAFLDQTRAYAERCRSLGLSVDETTAQGMNHVTVVLDAFARPGHPLNRHALAMMGVEA